jgi:hypothetical protein
MAIRDERTHESRTYVSGKRNCIWLGSNAGPADDPQSHIFGWGQNLAVASVH